MSRTTHQLHSREHRSDMLQSAVKRSPQLQSIPHLNRARDIQRTIINLEIKLPGAGFNRPGRCQFHTHLSAQDVMDPLTYVARFIKYA